MKDKPTSRNDKIQNRRSFIPKAFRGIYDRAVSGSSLRAAVNAQCLECVCWSTQAIRDCSDVGCPLHAVRPYQTISQDGREGQDMDQESKNSSQDIEGTPNE